MTPGKFVTSRCAGNINAFLCIMSPIPKHFYMDLSHSITRGLTEQTLSPFTDETIHCREKVSVRMKISKRVFGAISWLCLDMALC